MLARPLGGWQELALLLLSASGVTAIEEHCAPTQA